MQAENPTNAWDVSTPNSPTATRFGVSVVCMMLPLWWLEHLYRQVRRYHRQKRNTHNAHGVEGKREEHLVRLREELEGRTDSPARAGCVVVKQPQFREIFAADFRDYVGYPG